MKATLEFNLPEDDEDLRVAQDGWKWRLALCDLDEELRGMVKYAEREDWDNAEQIRGRLWRIVDDRGLSLP